ncbi:MAG: hypothetical protein GW809_03590 [Bacteroidetes bacterium]|nr:hypothetical protein [Bacteroidota bacterium]
MKKTIRIFKLLTIALLLVSFTSNNELKKNNNYQDNWKQATCYKYLYYNVIKDSYPGKWYIEFKNNYNANITMSVEIIDGYGGGRFSIESGQTSRSYYYTDNKNASSIYFNVNKVKFNDTSWGGPYYNCDF